MGGVWGKSKGLHNSHLNDSKSHKNMKFSYRFSNLLGTVYKCGNVCYSSDGNVLYSPVGNRISVFDLVNHTSYTLPFEARKNIARICVSNNGRFLISVDVDGKAIFANLRKRVVLYRFSFQEPVGDIHFSPDDKFIAVTVGKRLQLWYTPTEERHFAPMEKYLDLGYHFDDITSIQWSHSGDYLVTGCKDMVVRILSVVDMDGFAELDLNGHRAPVVNAFFTEDDMKMISVAEDGMIIEWAWKEVDEETWKRHERWIEKRKGHRVAKKRNEDEEKEGEEEKEEEKEEEEESEKEESEKEESEKEDSEDSEEEEEEESEKEAEESEKEKEQMEEELEEASEERPAKPVSIYKFGLWSAQQRFLLPECKGAIHATTADYNARAKLLIIGLTTGLFSLYEVPGFSLVHSLSIGTSDVSSCAINRSGDWLAFGCSQLGQLLVWEWQSETFVLKQQGHYYGISALEFSPDGSVIATGGDDGKVKLWSVMSGFCFVTFAEHTAAVTDICYVKGSHAIVSASLDGTVRAFDLVRYRNFRTLTTPTPVQFTCVTCDRQPSLYPLTPSSGDLIAAGTSAPFAIYIWSLRTGKLLDTLTGHEAPISCLQFNHRGTQLASGSWDHTVRTWDLLASGLKESLQHPAEILSLDWRRDDKELVASSLNGSVFIWNPEDATVLGSIDGRRDLSGGRRSTDEFTAQHNMQGKYFKSVCYSADGEFLIAAGQSKYVCIYSLRSKCLVRKYPLTQNLSLEGVLDKLNGKNMTEIGSKSELMEAMEDDGYAAPGVLKGDGAKRSARDEIYCNAVRFSPTGEMWAAASSQGLMVYSLDPSLAFDPFDLTEDVTPDAIRYALAGEEWAKALIYALHLNEEELIRQVLQSIPFDQIHPVCLEIPRLFLARLLSLLCAQANETAYVEYYLTWILHVLKIHGEYLRGNLRRYLPALRNVQKCLLEHYNRCKATADSNLYTLRFLSEK